MIALGRFRPLLTLLKVLVVLVAVDWWVAGPFFNSHIAPRYVSPFILLRDRTAAQNLSIVLDAIERTPVPRTRIAFVGDSTMVSAMGPDPFELPALVGRELGRRVPKTPVQIIQAGIVGLYAADAALWINKLLGRGAAVLVYGVSLRAFPSQPAARWVTRISSEQGIPDLERLLAAGGGPWLVRNVSGEKLAHGIVYSAWKTYAYRAQLRGCLGEFLRARVPSANGPFAGAFERPVSTEVPIAPRPTLPSGVEWTRAEYDLTNQNWEALELIGKLCRRYRPGRCVMYASPINPLGREQLAEPGLYEEYLIKVQSVAQRYGLIWRDYTDALAASEFIAPMFGGSRDAIHPNERGRQTLARLLAVPVAEAVRAAKTAEAR